MAGPGDTTGSAPVDARIPRDFALDAEGRVAEDLTCRHCGYGLRGLSPDQACPECRAPVQSAAHGDQLDACSPDWVRDIATGVRWFALTLLATITFMIVLTIVELAFFAAGGIIAFLIYLRQIAERTPDAEHVARSLRRVARGFVPAMVLFSIAVFLTAPILANAAPPLRLTLDLAAFAAFMLGLIGLIVFGLWLFVVLRRLHQTLAAAVSRPAL